MDDGAFFLLEIRSFPTKREEVSKKLTLIEVETLSNKRPKIFW
jgi:hypothetical protein